MNRIVVCIGLLTLLFSCKKEEVEKEFQNPNPQSGDFILVKGVVRDSLTGNPLSGIELLGPSSAINFISEANGDYRQYLSWPWSNQPTFTAQLADPLYYNATPPVSLFNYEYGDTIYQDIQRVPYSRINIHLNCTTEHSLQITDLAKPPSGSWESIIPMHPGADGYLDTTVVRYMRPYKQRDLVFYVGGIMTTTFPVQTGYGTVHDIEINYP